MSFQNQGLIGFGAGFAPPPIISANLVLHLDAGDADSWDSGVDSTLWRDLQSNYDFWLGRAAAVQGDEPTFNGTIGAKSSAEYWTFDPTDNELFHADAAYAGSILRTIGRTDTAFTIEVWVYNVDTTTDVFYYNNVYSSVADGFQFEWSNTPGSRFGIQTAPGSVANNNDTNVSAGVWHQLAVTGKTDNVVVGSLVIDGVADGTWQYLHTWTSGDSEYHGIIGGRESDAFFDFPAGSRLAIFRIYDTNLTVTQLANNFAANRGRFGI